jgi:paired amphipathic helix protein Sin3a
LEQAREPTSHTGVRDPTVANTSDNNNNRELNVSDALGYLEQVKNQFGDQPAIYNRFLEIMKEFKAQNIDTPGVIERVSSLFRAHPQLINGFNTFLPPGYVIESTHNPLDPVRVSTPQDHPPYRPALGPIDSKVPSFQSDNYNELPPINPQFTSAPTQLPPTQFPPAQVKMEEGSSGRKRPVELNHAISYVNKIKNRYSIEPKQVR